MVFSLLLVSIIEITVLHARKKHDHEWKNNDNYDVFAERVYYVACVEEKWDYAPSGKNLVSDTTITEDSAEATWAWGNGVDRIGSIYWKALYREFTDGCYKTQKRSDADKHLGALGPIFRALTGETIKVFYKNMCTFPTSIHPHGVAYDKTSEGAPYSDNDGATGGDIVAANGGKWIYIWHARDNMVDEGTSSKMWLYHSHVNAIKDSYAGLFGAIIITKNGEETSNTNLKPKDVDKEFTTFMVEYEERDSQLFERNLATISDGDDPDLIKDEDFIESNKMHSINGYLFGNLVELLMDKCETVRWYTCSIGNEVDGPHSPHWHGNIVFDSLGDNTDTVSLIPGTTYTTTMIVDSSGIWLYHCHVFDHIHGGMITTYTAHDNDKSCNGVHTGDTGDTSDDGKCFINEECGETEDCCSDNINPRDFGITCSSKYKGKEIKGCCVKAGYSCSNDDECCKKNTLCYQHICTNSHKIPTNRRLLMQN